MTKRSFLLVLAVALCASALAGIHVFIFGSFHEAEMKLMGTSISLALFSLTGLSCSIWLERRQLLLLAYTGVVISVLAWVLSVFLIWGVDSYSSKAFDQLFKTGASGIVISVALAYSSLLLLLRSHRPLVDNIVYFTLGCLSVIALMLIVMIWSEWQFREQFWRALGVFSILTVLGTLLAPIARKIQSATGEGAPT